MAEIRLGRIKFVWQGDWQQNKEYFRDDLVKYGGNAYVCVAGHISSNFAYDKQASWNIIADGQEWKSDWQTAVEYKVNDIVKYGGNLYICNTDHTSTSNAAEGLPVEIANWTPYGENFAWKSDWAVSTIYKPNDIVKYNGNLYLAKEQHTSTPTLADGLESQLDKWELYSTSINWTGEWQVNYRYIVNDVVKYGGQIYICTSGHTSSADFDLGLENDIGNWQVFHEGVEFKGSWQANTRYKKNDLVKQGGGVWICIEYHTSLSNFPQSQDKWIQFIEGLEFEDTWQRATRYQPGDTVTYGGYQYIAKTLNVNIIPTTAPETWDLFSTGFRFRGDWGEDSTLIDYLVGDVVRIGSYTYVCIQDHQNQRPPAETYWQRLNTGIYWKGEWVDATVYDLGDAVSKNNNSYICIQGHVSDEVIALNAPDQVTGFGVGAQYWNALAFGPENNVLTTDGDLLFYSGAGPARLPIGEIGQSLVVDRNKQFPEWKYIGALNHIFYVEKEIGKDLPAPLYGKILSQPWKTLRYALEQVDKGPMYPEATYLLENNKAFIQNAVVVWVDEQITIGTGIWNNFTNSNIPYCRRDIGLIIDALIYDLRHGGNQKIRLATLSYFDNGSLITEIADENDQLVAALEQMLVIIDSVITNIDYVDANNTFVQYKNSNYIEEVDAQVKIQNLLSILTAALTAESIANLAAEYKPTNTVFVKTGRFYETLPMIIPENTAVVGDELRSTSIWPAESLVHTTDIEYNLSTLDHMASIISDIVTNTLITPTSGNSETQYTLSAAGTAGTSSGVTAITANANEIIDILQNGLISVDSITWSDPGVDTNRRYARELLQLNRAFIISELTTWINAQISSEIAPFTSSFTYDQTKCERDTGYIVDALSYDVQYQSNWATSISARGYFEGTTSVIGDPNQTAETVAAYVQLGIIVDSIVQGTYSSQNTNSGNVASTTEGTYVSDLVAIIEAVITAGNLDNLPATIYPDYTFSDSTLQDVATLILSRKSSLQNETVSYVKILNPLLNFNNATCYRDAGYMVDALTYDMVLGTNYQSLLVGSTYYRATTSAQLVLSQQLQESIAAVQYLNAKLNSLAYGGPGLRAIELVNMIKQTIDYKLNNVGTLPIKTGSNDPLTDTGYTYGVEVIEKNRNFIVKEIEAFITSTYTDTVTATSAGNNTIQISDTSWLQLGTAVKFTGTVDGGIEANVEYYVLAIVNSTEFKITTSRSVNTEYALGSSATSFTVSLSYELEYCNRDTNTYIDAIKYDLIYPGNYKSISAAGYYTVAVTGCKLENMFYMHNASGLRNCSLNGLDGRSDGTIVDTNITGLGTADAAGISRPLAGAYVSLDPGWNPQDTKTWIQTRSPYVQNVSTFGTGCVGMKVDGALHDGGNDSIVANDFTQILSDGIGFWVSNLGRSELVSVFTYYCHVGYLAENGGKVRATNGNNSYGDYGSVSKGVDITEVPITGEVDNRAFTATVERVIVNNEVLALEYLNAGQNYTSGGTTFTLTGDGYGLSLDSITTVDGGVYYVRLLDLNDSSGKFGGEGYYYGTNSAQSGNKKTITLSNTEVAQASQLIGLGIYIISGKGTGQYAKIINYNPTSKLATVATVNRANDQQYATVNPTLVGTSPLYASSLVIPDTDIVATAYTSSTGGRFLLGEILGTTIDYDPSSVTDLGSAENIKLAYDTGSNRLICLYKDAANSYIGTVATASISGTTATLSSGTTFAQYLNATIVYHPIEDQSVIFYVDGTTYEGKYVVGTDTGSGMTFGSATTWASANTVESIAAVYDPDQNQIILANQALSLFYNEDISGNIETTSDQVTYNAISYDPNTNRVIHIFSLNTPSAGSYGVIGSLNQVITNNSGTVDNDVTISWGASSLITTASEIAPRMVFDTINNRLIYFYISITNGNVLSVKVIELAAGTNTFAVIGNTTQISSGQIENQYSVVYDAVSGNVIISYKYQSSNSYYRIGTVNPINNTITLGNEQLLTGYLELKNCDSLNKFGGTISSNFYFIELVNNLLVFGPANAIGFSPWSFAYDSHHNCVIFAGNNVVKAGTVNSDDTLNVYAGTQSLGVSTSNWGFQWSSLEYDPFSNETIIAVKDISDNGLIARVRADLDSASGVAVISPVQFDTSVDYLYRSAYLTDVNKVIFSYSSPAGPGGQPHTVIYSPEYNLRKTVYRTCDLSGGGITFGNILEIAEEFEQPSGTYNTIDNHAVFSHTTGSRIRTSIITNNGTDVTRSNTVNLDIVGTNSDIAYNPIANKIAVNNIAATNLNVITGQYLYLESQGSSQYTIGTPVNWQTNYTSDPTILGNIVYSNANDYFAITSVNYNTNVLEVALLSTETPGWNHMVPGYAVESVLDGTTTYSLEPLLTFSDSDTYPSDFSKIAKGRAIIDNEQIVRITLFDPGEGYTSPPTINISDPNNTSEVPMLTRIGNGVLAQPTWVNRGTDYTALGVDIAGDGYADYYQPGTLIMVKNLSGLPQPGSNVVFGHLPNNVYKLVTTRQVVGTGQNNSEAPFTAQLQVSPQIEIIDAPEHNETFELRLRYSQIRLTGHDFLQIGTGNFTNTNYPGIPLIDADSDKETIEYDGGRVFYTSTDQDGNFRVGDLFSVEQATGVATLNADAFNVAGLQELSLGELGLGSTGVTITEFSTDGTFTANSDNIVPTQKAIKTYITSQIGGGSSTLNVNSITAGEIIITGTEITTISGNQITFKQKVYFKEGVDGVPAALNYFLKD